jgi:predicted phosphodiesterase
MPYEDRKVLKALIRFVGEWQPDEVVHLGDLMDFPQPSRWSKDTAAEFQGSVFEDAEYAKRHFFEPLRAVYDGPVGVIEGNHDERPRVYLAAYAPALAESNAFDLPNLLDFDSFGVTLLPDFYKFAPDWIITHGHKGGINLSQICGNTALNAAKRMGTSVIMGHTHRLGIASYTHGYDGDAKVITGFEAGNTMNMKLAQYLKGGTANWQQGFGLVTVDAGHTAIQRIAIEKGRFIVDGVTYTVS